MTDADNQHPAARLAPSSWVVRFAHEIPAGGSVLDVACGRGRHTRLLLRLGHAVIAVDRDIAQIADLRDEPNLSVLQADLEADGWPLHGAQFAGVIVTNYLWRPLLPDVVTAVAPGGVLIYDTFALGQEHFGHPRNPDFLLRPGELLEAVRGKLQPIACEHGVADGAVRSRICARRPG